MILHTLLTQFTDQEILRRLLILYPDEKKSKKGYYSALQVLRLLRPTMSSMNIIVETIPKDEWGDAYISVVGKKNRDLTCWALDYEDWEVWMGYTIHPISMKHFSLLDIMCHCLWELTWQGFDQKSIKKRRDEISERLEDVKKDIQAQKSNE